MNRLRFPLLAAMALVLPVSALRSAPVPAARTGLEQVPATAPLVIHLRGVQGARGRFVAMMQKALPDVLKKILPRIDDFIANGPDNMLKGRKLRGLAKNGPIFLAFTELPKPHEDGEAKIAIILAVNNYKEFRDGLLTQDQRITDEGNGIEAANFDSSPVYFVDRKGYAVVSPYKEVAKAFTKKFPGLHTKLSKEQTAKLLSGDLGLYVNMDTINNLYGEQIKEAKDAIENQLAPLAAVAEESQKKLLQSYLDTIGPTFQLIEDLHALAVTIELRPGGLAVYIQGEMRENTRTANLLRDSRPAAFPQLERLPGGRAMYFGMKASSGLYKYLGGLMSGLSTGDSKVAAALMQELAKAGPDISLMGASFPLAGLSVYHYDNPTKAVATTLQTYRIMDPKAALLKEKPVVKANAEKYGGFQLHSVQLTYDFDKMAEAAPQLQKDADARKMYVGALKGLIGEKMTTWFGTDGKTVVQILAPDWTTARKMLDQYSKGTGTAGEMQALRDVRKEMPTRTSVLALIDAVNLFGVVFKVIKPLVPAGQLPGNLPDLSAKKTASFVGVSLTLQPNRGSFDLFITAAAAREFYKTIKPLLSE